jgi:DNA repair protein RadC
MTPIALLPTTRKPRERLQAQGVHSLELEDLLAIVLRTGTAGEDVLSLSRQVANLLVNGCDSLVDLAAVRGVGLAKATEVVAALNLHSALQQRMRQRSLCSPEEIYAACQDLIVRQREELVVFYLTVRNGQLGRETVSLGTATASLVHPREVFRPAILHNASHIVLAHNHPSGDPTPSQADLAATKTIAQAGQQVGIELLDHVVCASSGFVSLKTDAPELFN